jgi:hypothetical protein
MKHVYIIYYIQYTDRFITTYISKYYKVTERWLNVIFEQMNPLYNSNVLAHAPVCGANSIYVCNNLTPFHLYYVVKRRLYMIILLKAELLIYKGGLSVKSNSCLITFKDADLLGRHLKC